MPATRIVSLTPTGFDILSELGMDPIRCNRGSYFLPDLSSIAKAKPDLIIGCTFPHQFWVNSLQQISPVYLVPAGGGIEAAYQQLRDVAHIVGRQDRAEESIRQLEIWIEQFQVKVRDLPKPTVVMMGGSHLNVWTKNLLIETQQGAFGSVIKDLVNFPWPQVSSREKGMGSATLKQICASKPHIVFVQSYSFLGSKQPLSQQLASDDDWIALQKNAAIYEVDNYWHQGRGTGSIRRMLNDLMPKIYP